MMGMQRKGKSKIERANGGRSKKKALLYNSSVKKKRERDASLCDYNKGAERTRKFQ